VGVLLFGIFSWVEHNTRAVFPGRLEIVTEAPEKYIVFYEYKSEVGGDEFSTPHSFPGLECRVRSFDTEKEAPLSTRGSSRYSMGGRKAYSLYTFHLDEAGRYEFSAHYPEGKSGPEVVLAIGPDRTLTFILSLFVSIAILLISIFSGLFLFGVPLRKRR
jgi:hypothetical protein